MKKAGMKQSIVKRMAVLSVALGLVIGQSIPAYAAGSATYLDSSSGEEKEVTEGITDISPDLSEWTSGWLRVSGEIKINSRVRVNGTVNLLLEEGCMLEIPKGITVEEGNGLTIYGQSAGTGKLYAGTDKDGKKTCDDGNAGIGGNGGEAGKAGGNAGTITIYGGEITATSGKGGAGIGGGAGGNGGTGEDGDEGKSGPEWQCRGGKGGAGAEGGIGGNGGTIEIYGGTITAEGTDLGTGIGGGAGGKGGAGGEGGKGVKGKKGVGYEIPGAGGKGGVGGNGGQAGAGGSITIYDGTVYAKADDRGAGIGGGAGGDGGVGGKGGVAYKDWKLRGDGGLGGEGGVGGAAGDAGTITIKGGKVVAKVDKRGTAIGGGSGGYGGEGGKGGDGKKGSGYGGVGGEGGKGGNAVNITITSSDVKAESDNGGTGIGAGQGGIGGYAGRTNLGLKMTGVNPPVGADNGSATIIIGWAEADNPVQATNYLGDVSFQKGLAVDTNQDTGTTIQAGTMALIVVGSVVVVFFIGFAVYRVSRKKTVPEDSDSKEE